MRAPPRVVWPLGPPMAVCLGTAARGPRIERPKPIANAWGSAVRKYSRRSMAQTVETDITVQRFGFVSDDSGRRLRFPRAESHQIEGSAGAVTYGARDCAFDDLEGRL